jgi:ELWxxDGT repeat protein
MKPSPSRRWFPSQRADNRGRRRRRHITLEALEQRVALSLTPQMVMDINPGIAPSFPSSMVAIGSTAYFAADDGVNGGELWKSDGTAAGTTLVKDIFPGQHREYDYYRGGWSYVPNSSSPSSLANVNGTLFFTATDDSGGRSLWKSDGTESGTVRVSTVDGASLTNANGTLFFMADFWGDNGLELWKSDGTTAGTTMVKDIFPGQHREYSYDGDDWWYVPNSSYPGDFTSVNGTLFFTADDGTSGRELWKSDGTEAGTVKVKDIRSGSISGSPHSLTNVNGTLFFSANDGVQGAELWKSDGTTAGTVPVKLIHPSGSGSYPHSLANVNGTVFFTANDGTTGPELWKSDGTEAGTVQVKDIRSGGAGSGPNYLTNVNGTLFFMANDGVQGHELWKSDGTAAGTTLVKDIHPNALTAVGDTLFFRALDESYYGTLWKSDGTTAGTQRVADLDPVWLRNVNGTLFFAADDGTHGRELWTLVDDGMPPPPVLNIADVTVTEGNSGTTNATFTVTLSAASAATVTVSYTSADGTAVAPSDYTSASGSLTFAPGQTSKTITVPIVGDRRGEPNETFFVNLSSPTNATIADGQGMGTIVDDEPRISISDVTRVEGNSGTTSFVFTVTLSAAYDVPVTVDFATADGTARTGNSDYVGTTGTLTFAPGQTTKTVTVIVKGDKKKESNETFFVNLSGATNALMLDSQGVGTILNDDSGTGASLGNSKGIRMLARRRRGRAR